MEKAIAPILEKMKVGQVEAWPIERNDSVRVTVSRIQVKHRREGWKYRMNIKGMEVHVTRAE